MATDLETLRIKLTADVNDLKVGLAQAQSAIKGVDDRIKQADSGMKKFTGSLKTMAGTLGVAFAGTQLVSFAKDAVMAASNMAESVSKVNVVFGQGAQEVFKFGESAATNLGISNQAALEAAGTYGNLFQAFGLGQGQAQDMSTSLVQLAADMASFNNTSIDDAIVALRSGLSGETEPLKRFGVALSDVRLKTEAMSLGLIKSTSDALTPAAKAQASYALIMKDTALAQGDYARTADGTANTMKSLKAKIDDAKVALGEALMPAFRAVLKILELLVPMLQKFGDFIKENGRAIAIYSGILLLLVGSYKTYRAALLLGKAAQDLFMLSMTLLRGGTLLSIASTNGLAASMLKLNVAMRANPIGLIVTALTAVGALFVYAWKHSETFRSVVIKGVQTILNWWALLIEGIGKFLSLLSKVPGMGWAKGIADGALKAANAIKTASKNLADLKSNFKGMGNVSMTTGTAGVTGGSATKTSGGIIDPNAVKEAAAKEKQRLKDIESNQKKLAKLYEDVEKVKRDAAKKTAEAEKDLLKANATANKRFEEQKADLYARNADAIDRAEKARAKTESKARETNTKELIKIGQDYRERVEKIDKQYADRKASLEKQAQEQLIAAEKNYLKKITDLRQKASEKAADIIKKGAEKEASLIKQSIDRLRNAFASKTGFSLTEAFGKGVSGKDLLNKLAEQIKGSRNLAEKAEFLAQNGFSQPFIEQVMAAGPEVGNELADAILNAGSETIEGLKNSFNEMEKVSNTALDVLAASMNKGGNLATDELRKAYDQVAIDVKEALEELNLELQKSLEDAAKEYAEHVEEIQNKLKAGLIEAKTLYDEALAEAAKMRDEAIAESIAKLDEALKEADEALKEALEEANKNLAEGLTEAQKELADALVANQEAFEEKIAEIHASMTEKLNDLKAQILTILALLAQLGSFGGGGGGGGGGGASQPSDWSVMSLGMSPTEIQTTATSSATKVVGDTNVTINGVNLTDPQGTAQNIVTMIKYGQTVQVASTNLSGIETTGLNAYRAGIVRTAQ